MEDGGNEPLLYILSSCTELIRTLPTLQHDETNVEDLDTEGEDHAADALRYGCMSRPWMREAPKTVGIRYPKLPQETTINEWIKKRTNARLLASEDA
jgi:hypothetical protein